MEGVTPRTTVGIPRTLLETAKHGKTAREEAADKMGVILPRVQRPGKPARGNTQRNFLRT